MTASQPNLLQRAKQGDTGAIAALMNRSLQPKGITAKVSLKEHCLKVMLEASQVPEQQPLVEFVHKGITGLNVEAIKQLKIYGRELGEDFPNWQEEMELAVQAVTDFAALAKQRDMNAISMLVTQWLEAQNVTAKVSLKNGCLRIMLEAVGVPDQQVLVPLLLDNVRTLGIQGCTTLKLSGREPGDDFPDWQQDLALDNQVVGLTLPPESASEAQILESVALNLSSEIQAQQGRLELARQGNLQAIHGVVNYLQPQGVTATVDLKGECLFITLLADQTHDQDQTVAYLHKIFDKLNFSFVKQVKVSGRRKDAFFAAWSQELNLGQPLTEELSFWGSMFGAIAGAVEAVSGTATYAGGAVAGTVAGTTDSVGNAAVYAGGAIANTAIGFADTVSNTALQATDGVGYVLDMVSSSPHLQELTKVLKVDWLVKIADQVDVVKAETQIRNLQRKYPNDKPDAIAHRVMLEKSLYVGGTGFASSLLPGFATAMFAVDLAATTAIQAEMVYQIACAYGLNLHEPARKGEVMAIFGLALGGGSALKAGLGFARNVPGAGALIGASSNAAMLYALGYAACRFYEAKLNPPTFQAALQASQVESEKYLQGAIAQEVIMDQILVHIVLAGNPGKTWAQMLPALQSLNFSPASLEAITANSKAPPSLEHLLGQVNSDFAIPLLAQCQKIAQQDGVVTPQEAKALATVTNKLNINLTAIK